MFLDVEYLKSKEYELNQMVLIRIEIISLIQQFDGFFSLKSPFTSLFTIVNILKENLFIYTQNNQKLKEFINGIKNAVKEFLRENPSLSEAMKQNINKNEESNIYKGLKVG